MKTVGLFTIPFAPNYGSFLQAYALEYTLRQLGYRVIVYDLVRSLRFRLKRHWSLSAKRRRWKQRFNEHVNRDSAHWNKGIYRGEQLDIAVCGSDEIWNVHNPTLPLCGEFFGLEVNASRKVAYAPSIGDATPAALASSPFVRGIADFDVILPRDAQTQAAVKALHPQKAGPIVLDPTLLETDWADHIPPRQSASNAVVYYGHRKSPACVDALKRYCKQRGVPLLSACFPQPWCDRVVADGPLAFVGQLSHASLVVTDRLHGALLATALGRPLAVIPKKSKTLDFITRWDLQDALLYPPWDFQEVMHQQRPEKSRSALLAAREKSLELLRNALDPAVHSTDEYTQIAING